MVDALTIVRRCLPIWLALLAFPFSGFGHRLDEYLQAALVSIEPSAIKLQIHLAPGIAVAEPVLALMDRDGDGVISTNEATAYAQLLKHDLTLQIDERPLELKFTASNFPPPDELGTGWGIIRLDYAAAVPGPFAPGAHELAFENRHQTNLSAYLVNAVLPRSSSIHITGQTRNENQSVGRIEFTFQPPPRSPVVKLGVAALVMLLVAVTASAALRRRTLIAPIPK